MKFLREWKESNLTEYGLSHEQIQTTEWFYPKPPLEAQWGQEKGKSLWESEMMSHVNRVDTLDLKDQGGHEPFVFHMNADPGM